MEKKVMFFYRVAMLCYLVFAVSVILVDYQVEFVIAGMLVIGMYANVESNYYYMVSRYE